jgi:hypothetical protein
MPSLVWLAITRCTPGGNARNYPLTLQPSSTLNLILRHMKRIGIVLLILVLLGAGLWLFGRPAYRRQKEDRFVRQTQEFMARKDYRNASLAARQTLALDPTNLVACEALAELASLSRAPASVTLELRRRIATIAPTATNRLLLASAALKAQGRPYPLATQILEELGRSATNLPAYHLTAAELALRLNKPGEAESHIEAAARLEPANALHQYNLAVLRLSATNTALADAARATLERLRQDTNFGILALRSLAVDRLRAKDWAAAEALSKALVSDPRCAFDDRIQHLTILRERQSHGLPAAVDSLKRLASTNAAEIYALATWMTAHNTAADALRWLTNLPSPVRAQQPLPLAEVDAFIALKDWRGLEAHLKDKPWAEMEFMRQAFLSQAAFEQKNVLSAESRWRAAMREAGSNFGPLMGLLGLADLWKRAPEREELLWRIADRFPENRWTLHLLEQIYTAARNTRGLNRVYAAIVALNPKDVAARNNLATTSFLLKANVSRAHEIAGELYRERPDDPVIASTRALSLHLSGQTQQGLALMQKLKPESLERPAIALYYGVLLAAGGDTVKARKYLDLAEPDQLLPEEKDLLEAARKAH